MTIIQALERENLKPEVPSFNVGDTVKVYNKIVEGNRERIQVFEGVVISRKNSSVRETFTVRRMSFGVGVEKTFPIHSPKVAEIPPCFLAITIPSNACNLSLSPSITLTITLTVSPTANSGMLCLTFSWLIASIILLILIPPNTRRSLFSHKRNARKPIYMTTFFDY